jgi:DNA-binding CsgD family transcriptional regulator
LEKPTQGSPKAIDTPGGLPHSTGAPNALAWLRLLVRQLRSDPERVTSGEANLLLEFDVDGAQCLLIERRRPTSDYGLSNREQQIASMVARGYPDKTIAVELGISRWTVSTHLRRTYVKVGVHSRAAMVAKLADERLAWPELVPPNGGNGLQTSSPDDYGHEAAGLR